MIILKKASMKDCRFFYRVHTDVDRRFYSTKKTVSFEEHQEWYRKNYKKLTVIYNELAEPVGVIRSQAAEILSIAVLPNYQGRGYGTESLMGYKAFTDKKLVAVIHPKNIASRKSFSRAGFKKEKLTTWFK